MSKTHRTGRSLSFFQVRAGLLKLTCKLGTKMNVKGYSLLSSNANPHFFSEHTSLVSPGSPKHGATVPCLKWEYVLTI